MAARSETLDIPHSLDALTPEWLAGALGERWLGEARVSRAASPPLT